ncbi:response regulator [Schlesneria sp. T3-172]|uniref:response regulator n=1 Tax=Schlesneria sphaerica TaxID=3373610 RepID=UPI0037C8A914
MSQQHPSGIDPPGRRTLVVDDHVDSANALGMLLKMHGQDVQVAYSGRKALEVTQSFSPEVAIIDLQMPGINGFELISLLRQKSEFQEIIIVAVSVLPEEEARKKAFDAGCNVVLLKPLRPESIEILVNI